jgi:predicted transcriptional regulator
MSHHFHQHCHPCLYSKLQDLQDRLSMILDENFMMNIFEEYLQALPPFKEYWDLMYSKKQMKVVCCTDCSSKISAIVSST